MMPTYLLIRRGKLPDDDRMLRRVAGGWIATDEPGRVRRLLGLPEDDSGIRPLVYLPDGRDDD